MIYYDELYGEDPEPKPEPQAEPESDDTPPALPVDVPTLERALDIALRVLDQHSAACVAMPKSKYSREYFLLNAYRELHSANG
jgi:hypothetical protein